MSSDAKALLLPTSTPVPFFRIRPRYNGHKLLEKSLSSLRKCSSRESFLSTWPRTFFSHPRPLFSFCFREKREEEKRETSQYHKMKACLNTNYAHRWLWQRLKYLVYRGLLYLCLSMNSHSSLCGQLRNQKPVKNGVKSPSESQNIFFLDPTLPSSHLFFALILCEWGQVASNELASFRERAGKWI